ncbi:MULTISPECIES: PAS domain-containing protein [Natrialbaceae]|uniref:PAS domain-containing protein n=1 Tax=Natrialbaceae TaxID=1644061 RepID=UPI00207D083A|nr:PAS domain-containing protein [Natronococcus sp. CG52]
MTSSPYTDADSAVHARIRQQEVVAELGQQALETDDLDRLMHDAAVAVAETLDVEYATVLELSPGGDEVVLRHGVGWQNEVVDEATIPATLDSRVGYTLHSEEPIIVTDYRTEERFSDPDLLIEHGVVSGISVVIGSAEEPRGVLGTHSTEEREFTEHDANFVQSVANVLATAIENKAAHSQLREIHERITNGVLALNEEWEFTHVNQQAEESLGHDADELLGANIWELFPSLAGTEFEEHYREAMDSQESVSFEGYYPPFDAWFEEHAYPSETGLSVYFRDVTEQKQIEAELDEIYGRISDAFFALDEEWQFTYLNERAHELINPEDRALIGESVWEAFPEATERTFKSEYEEAMSEQETVSFEEYYPDPLNTWFDVRAYPSETGLSVYFRDITERKEREAKLEKTIRELRESEERLRLALKAGEMGTWELDLQTEESPVRSPHHDRIFGYEEPLDDWDFETFLEHVHPDDRVDVERRFEGAFETGEWEFDCRITRADGEQRVIAAQGVFYYDEGEPVRAVGVVQDVTEQKAHERQLEKSNQRLEQFAYAASHDLQEPLRMVSSYLSLIERRYGGELDDDAEEFLEFAVDGADRMREMVDGLLEYSRVDTQGDPLEPVDLASLVENVREDLQMQIAESDAQITTEDLPPVMGDDSQLRQVFQNLISNAIAYSGTEPPRIHIEADRRGRKWMLSVRDEGIGIDPDNQDRVFEVFQRLHSRENHSGTGIGLALCQRIVERHDGRIWVDSEPGEGSTFSFTLPAVGELDSLNSPS